MTSLQKRFNQSMLFRCVCILAVSGVSLLPLTFAGSGSARAETERSAGAEPVWAEAIATGRPHARHENSAATVGDEIFLIGGRGDRPLDIYHLGSKTWRVGAPPPFEINHAQAIVFDNRIYLIGALTGKWPQEPVVAKIQIYDPKSDTWSIGPEMPEERRRGGAGVVAHNNIIYLLGGNRLGHMSGYVPWMDSFDPATGVWKKLPDAPRPRDHFHAAVLDGVVYAAGGRRSSHDTGDDFNLTVPEVDAYDIGSGTWHTLDCHLPTPRAGVSVVAANGMLVVLGGESDVQTTSHKQVEAFSLVTNSWVSLPDLPVGRHGTQAVVIDNAIHMISGSANRGGGPELADHWILK